MANLIEIKNASEIKKLTLRLNKIEAVVLEMVAKGLEKKEEAVAVEEVEEQPKQTRKNKKTQE